MSQLQSVLNENKERFILTNEELSSATDKAASSYKLLPRTIVCIKEKEFHYFRTFGLLLEKSSELVKLGYELDTINSCVSGVGFKLLALKPKKLIKSDLTKMHNDIESDLLTIKATEKAAFVESLMVEQKAKLIAEAETEAANKATKLAQEISALIK
jgi:hypothetical protein